MRVRLHACLHHGIIVNIESGFHNTYKSMTSYTVCIFSADKCRSPYQGGCAELNRECSHTELDVSCDDCNSGYSEVVGACVQG